jgi:hypothetical protein
VTGTITANYDGVMQHRTRIGALAVARAPRRDVEGYASRPR